jgi:hypothetical protein
MSVLTITFKGTLSSYLVENKTIILVLNGKNNADLSRVDGLNSSGLCIFKAHIKPHVIRHIRLQSKMYLRPTSSFIHIDYLCFLFVEVNV